MFSVEIPVQDLLAEVQDSPVSRRVRVSEADAVRALLVVDATPGACCAAHLLPSEALREERVNANGFAVTERRRRDVVVVRRDDEYQLLVTELHPLEHLRHGMWRCRIERFASAPFDRHTIGQRLIAPDGLSAYTLPTLERSALVGAQLFSLDPVEVALQSL